MCLVQTECDCIKLKVHFHGLKIIGGKKKKKKSTFITIMRSFSVPVKVFMKERFCMAS